MVLFLRLHFYSREFRAIPEKLADQGALRFDSLPLFDDEHCHQPVGQEEQNRQNWQPAEFLAGSCWDFRDFLVFDRAE